MILIMRCDIDKTNKKKDENISGVYNKFGNAIFMKDRQLKQRTNVVEIKIEGSKLQFKRMQKNQKINGYIVLRMI